MTPEPYWAEEDVTLYLGKCEKVLPDLPPESVDAIVTDPPAAVSFMGRSWDSDLGGRDKWVGWLADCMEKAARVLKPGGHLLVWSLPRTSHWTAWALEDAGLEIRDCVLHLFGSGFPKSLDVSKAIDRQRDDLSALHKVTAFVAAARVAAGLSNRDIDRAFGFNGMAGHWTNSRGPQAAVPTWEQWQRLRGLVGFGDEMDAEVWRLNGRKGTPGEAWEQREVIGHRTDGAGNGSVVGLGSGRSMETEFAVTAPATEDAVRWQGFGTALKPGQEMWWLARKPIKGTVAANVLQFGTGALNIDGCKVAHASEADLAASLAKNPGRDDTVTSGTYGANRPQQSVDTAGRWPTNIVLTHSAACKAAGTRLVRGDSRSGQDRGQRPGGFGDVGAERGDERPNGVLYGDQMAEMFDCAPDCPVGELDRQSGVTKSSGGANGGKLGVRVYGAFENEVIGQNAGGLGDIGGASRFYPTFRYQAKAPASERPRLEDGTAHETVKSLDLTRWQVRLLCPPGGTVLDMFGGSGPVAEACIIEGFRCIVIEQDPKSAELIKTRLSKPIQPTMLTVDDSAQPARPHPVAAASRPKPPPEAHPSLFDQEAS